MKGRRILVTGARGFVGAEVTRLLSDAGARVVALVRTDGDILANDGTRVPTSPYEAQYPEPGRVAKIAGDVSEPDFGIGEAAYGALQRDTDLVVHCAAVTSFGLSPQKYERINVGGARSLLQFATAARRIPLVYTSTAYVAGERTGLIQEHELDCGQQHGNPYEASKFAAEKLVRAAMAGGLPVIVVRPGIIVGDSGTGRIAKFDTLYTVVRLTSAGLVRTLPGDYGATLDVVPIDWVARGVLAAVERFEEAAGRTLHLVSSDPVTLKDLNAVCAEFPSFQVPRYVPRHLFDATALPAIERRYYREVVSLYESYYYRRLRFSRQATRDVFPEPLPKSGRALLRTVFDYAVKVGYFGRRDKHASAE